MNALKTLVSPRGAVFLLLLVFLIAITALNPSFAEPGQLMRFIQRVAPVAIVAIGQYFVIVGGEFDLSMGSVVTAQVVIAGNLVGQDESRTVPVLLLMFVIGAAVGLINGLIKTLLKVPSFIVTLGMMLGAPRRHPALDWRGGDGQPSRWVPRDRAWRDQRRARARLHPVGSAHPHRGARRRDLVHEAAIRAHNHRARR